MLVSFSWLASPKMLTLDIVQTSLASALAQSHFSLFTLHFSLQQLTWYRLNYLTTDYLTTLESSIANISHFCHIAHPSVHNQGRGVCGEDNLCIRVQLANQVNQTLLPIDVQGNLRLIH